MNPDDACTAARFWLSADRDGEAGPDPDARAHLEGCRECSSWADAFDQLTRHARLRAPMAPASLTVAVNRIATTVPPPRRVALGPALLLLASVSGAIMLVLNEAGIYGHSHLTTADGRQAEALTIALLGGFALAAWRPARLAAGLLPVAVFAAAITLAVSIVEVASGAVPLVGELAHLPLLIGAVGAHLATRTTNTATEATHQPALVHRATQGA